MRNTWLIAKREYLERIRAKSFIIMTILIPTLMGGILFASVMVNGRAKSSTHIAVVSPDAQFGLDLQAELGKSKRAKVTVDVISPPGADTRSMLNGELQSKDLDGYLWVEPIKAGKKRPQFEWVPRSKTDIITKSRIEDAVQTVLTREELAHSGMGASDVDAIMQPVDLDSSQAAQNDSAGAAIGSAYGLFFLMYFTILFYCMNVARSIIEEKNSRIFEVLLATIRPEEMMAGKILGVGAVGLTQMGIWIIAGVGGSAMMAGGLPVHLTATQFILFILFFLLGYILYSGIAAGLGALAGTEQELQQMNIFLMLPLIACSTIIFRVITDPEGILAKVFSFIPFCTPLIMYVRIVVHQPPWYQIAISIVELAFTIYAMLWLSTRIYRVGILMYGKRPSLPEMLRWLKYS